jgi:hypothetical protein
MKAESAKVERPEPNPRAGRQTTVRGIRVAQQRMVTSNDEEVVALRTEVTQLQHALDSRVVIEQAKGILAERYDLTIEDAFLLLRYAARSSRVAIRPLAAKVVLREGTPAEIRIALAKTQRLRAAGQRDRAQAGAEEAQRQRDGLSSMEERMRGAGKTR